MIHPVTTLSLCFIDLLSTSLTASSMRSLYRKASNIGVWGESGMYPLIYECINQTTKYFQRVKNLNDGLLVYLAFREQEKMELDWYRKFKPVLELLIRPSQTIISLHSTSPKVINPSIIITNSRKKKTSSLTTTSKSVCHLNPSAQIIVDSSHHLSFSKI